MFERIVVGLDGSALAEQVLPHVEGFAERFGSQILLVRAVSHSTMRSLGRGDEGLPAATAYLETAAERLRGRGLSVACDARQDDPADALVAAAAAGDLIALTTHGRTGLRRAVYGSVAQDVLQRAPCPVLVVRASETDDGSS